MNSKIYLSWLMLLAIMFLSVTAKADVKIENAWLRLLPPSSKMTAAYMQITSDQEDRLVSVHSDLAKSVEIHQSKMENGVISMNEVSCLYLPQGEMVELKPQGYHLMVMGLKKALKEGDTHQFILEFEHAEPLTIILPVKSP